MGILFKLLSFRVINSIMLYGNILLYIILLNYLFLVSHCLASLSQGVSGDSENNVDPV